MSMVPASRSQSKLPVRFMASRSVGPISPLCARLSVIPLIVEPVARERQGIGASRWAERGCGGPGGRGAAARRAAAPYR
ncbi:hypothetical protein GCM10010393_26180 [Streptomyces gobitricini]|uniref:Uncharacterized protein n=1 Tax=Streptomyces gobitricini TaxID=68211 RepID=A0ABP5Z5X9_9ACTN